MYLPTLRRKFREESWRARIRRGLVKTRKFGGEQWQEIVKWYLFTLMIGGVMYAGHYNGVGPTF